MTFSMPPAPQLVEPRVADVADKRTAVAHDDRGEDAGHAVPLGPQARQAMDLVVRDRDRFAQPQRDRAGLALQPGPEHLHRGVGGLAAGRLAADAVDDHEEPARRVDMEPVLVDLALQSRVGLAGRSHGRECPGRCATSSSVRGLQEKACPCASAL